MAASSVYNGPISVIPNNPGSSEPPAQDGPSTEFPAEPPRVGMSFDSMPSAKKYITEWCARERIPYSVWKADRRCWVLTCKDKNNCMFRLRVKNIDRPTISILEAHTCSSLSFRRTAQTGGPIKATPYNWPHDASLNSGTTALVLIDMQRDCHRPDLSTLGSREAFRSQNNTSGLGIGYPGPLGRFMIRGEEGHDIIPELYPVPGEPIVDKPGRSAFAHTDFALLLKNKGIQNLVVAGFSTDTSVNSTIREATDRGFDCLLVEDGSVAKDARLHKAACESIALGGGTFGATGKLHHVAGQLEFMAHDRRNGVESGIVG
ncbi:MAG: hypothetical protein Q9191_002366 [Dirinaria sp. TL-2023a]